MIIPPQLMDSAKKVFKSVRVANIHPTGVLATRALVLVMLVPILLVVIEYVMAVATGYVSDETGKLISTGINIIDHIFIPSVLNCPCRGSWHFGLIRIITVYLIS